MDQFIDWLIDIFGCQEVVLLLLIFTDVCLLFTLVLSIYLSF